MIIDDTDLATLEAADLTRAQTCARALEHSGHRLAVPALGRVGASLLASLDAEAACRRIGLPRGSVRLAVDAFADDHPDAAERSRRTALPYLAIARDDPDERPAVRELFAAVMDTLADPTPTARAVELARLEALAGASQW